MRQQLTVDNNSSRLILFFAGYGMDCTPFSGLGKEGYDTMVVYDYTDYCFDSRQLGKYKEIVVIAWSMGVFFADRVIASDPSLPFTKTVAVNGTLVPVDDERGIPPSLFLKTAEMMTDEAVGKFYRRVCGGHEAMSRLMPEFPARNAADMKAELLSIYKTVVSSGHSHREDLWDEIFISSRDLIFPVTNMKRAWKEAGERVTIVEGGSHLVDFKELAGRVFVDKDLVGSRFSEASSTYDRDAEVQRMVADDLSAEAERRLPDGLRHNAKVIEVGAGCGMLTSRYLKYLDNCDIETWDIVPQPPVGHGSNLLTAKICDAETQIRQTESSSVDIMFSSSTLQWFNSPRSFIRQVARVLRPGGFAFISCYAKGTFAPFESIEGVNVLRYPSFGDELKGMAAVDIDRYSKLYTIWFPNAREALRHLRQTGVNALRRSPLSVPVTRRLMEGLTSPDGRASLTFNAQFIILHKTVEKETIFVTGIDTDAGKSYATGWLANELTRQGRKVMTQKFIQTGNVGRSEDIELHRLIMGQTTENEPWEDTAPVIFSYPASPHLSAKIDGTQVDLNKIDAARKRLEAQCDTLLIEGAGGLMVPVDEDLLTIDYILSRRLDVALVTNGRLGSISHTLLALEAIRTRGLKLRYLLYNAYFDSDKIIAEETRLYIQRRVAKDFPDTRFLIVPAICPAGCQ